LYIQKAIRRFDLGLISVGEAARDLVSLHANRIYKALATYYLQSLSVDKMFSQSYCQCSSYVQQMKDSMNYPLHTLSFTEEGGERYKEATCHFPLP
jgi:hypothetical protein